MLLSFTSGIVGIKASRLSRLCLICASIGDLGGITSAFWVGSLGNIASHLLSVLLSERRPLLKLVACVLCGEVRYLVPGVVLSWAIDLAELVLVGVDPVGRVLCGIARDIS